MKKLFKITLILIILLFLAAGIPYLIFNESLPSGKPGKEADALATKMLKALDYKAYQNTQYLEWSFRKDHNYKWDKKNHTVEVMWGENKVLLHTVDTEKSKVLKPENKTEDKSLIEDALSYFNNDSFWLVAPYKVFDPGTERRIVFHEEKEALLITYKSGGSTPGDSYLWILDEKGFPQSFKMWVKIIPIGGMKADWSEWTTTSSGAKLPIKQELFFGDLNLGEVKGYN